MGPAPIPPAPAPLGRPADGWIHRSFEGLEDHRAALLAARPNLGWETNLLSPGLIRGTMLSVRRPRYAVTFTDVEGDFEMRGPAASDGPVLALGIGQHRTGYQWMRPVAAGMIALYQPRDAIDAINLGRIRFAAIDLSEAVLEEEARHYGYHLPPAARQRSGVAPGAVAAATLDPIARLVEAGHRGAAPALPPGIPLDALVLAAVVRHLGAVAGIEDMGPARGHCRIVARARAYIDAHLDQPIAIDDLAAASFASRRTLHRAFVEVLGETPLAYVLKLRLNRIRRDLASPAEALRTVTTVSHRWGIGELGRLASRYRSQFGELPSQTLARRQPRQSWAA